VIADYRDLAIADLADENQVLVERCRELEAFRSLAYAAIDLIRLAQLFPDQFHGAIVELQKRRHEMAAAFVAEVFREQAA
jgi:hypothetical protein